MELAYVSMSRQRCGSFEFHRFKGIPLPRQNQTPRKLWFKIGKHYCMTVGVGCDLPPPISIPTSLSRIRGRTPGTQCACCCCYYCQPAPHPLLFILLLTSVHDLVPVHGTDRAGSLASYAVLTTVHRARSTGICVHCATRTSTGCSFSFKMQP